MSAILPMMKNAYLLLVALVCTACDKKLDATVVKRADNPDYIRVNGENEAKMDAAIARAKKEIDPFIHALANPTPSQSYFSVKKPFSYKDGDATGHEHIWLTDVTFKDGKFHGLVGNEPVDVTDVKLGDAVTVEKSEASDWMIIDDDTLVGGYTIIALREQMPEKERKQFDESFPFKITAE